MGAYGHTTIYLTITWIYHTLTILYCNTFLSFLPEKIIVESTSCMEIFASLIIFPFCFHFPLPGPIKIAFNTTNDIITDTYFILIYVLSLLFLLFFL